MMNETNFKVSTHVLDTTRGKPAANLVVTLYMMMEANNWIPVSTEKTNDNGRCAGFGYNRADLPFRAGTYMLKYEVKDYFRSLGSKTMYPFIEIVFEIENPEEHYHIPLLLTNYGYSTYRGS